MHAESHNEIGLAELLNLLWKSKPILAASIVAFLLAATCYLFLAPKTYQVQVILAPVEQMDTSQMLGGLGGLAAIAGMNLQRSSAVQESIAALRSRDLLREFIEREQLLPVLFPDLWDPARGVWRASDDVPPDVRDGVSLLDERVRSVSEDRRSGLVVLSISWSDPAIASEWATGLVALINERLRTRALDQAERNVAYLKTAISETNINAVQQALSRLLESEMQKQLLARGEDEFAFRTVDGPEVPKRPVSPRALVIVFSAFVFGLVAGFLFVLFRSVVLPRMRH